LTVNVKGAVFQILLVNVKGAVFQILMVNVKYVVTFQQHLHMEYISLRACGSMIFLIYIVAELRVPRG
jgi:hypothetical protein